MTFKNLQELIEKKERLEYEKYPYYEAYNQAIIAQKKCVRKKNKEYWDSVIENYKEKVIEYDNKIEKIELIISNTIKFPKEIFIPFILECINLHEEEKYESRSLMLSLSSHLITSSIPAYGNFEMIFPVSLKEQETKLEKSFYISVLQFAYHELFKKANAKYTMIPTEGYINLLSEDLSYLTYYKDFPYLEDIGLSLIERRLNEPDKKIIDILNDELSELKETKKSKNLCK